MSEQTKNTQATDELQNQAEASSTQDVTSNQSKASTDETMVEMLKETIEEEKDKYIRLFAEFENYKRRTSKERVELFKTANQEVLIALLPVLDDFERAFQNVSSTAEDATMQGMKLIYDKFKSTLTAKGLELVEVKTGDVFNADFAEAITQIPAPSEDLKGKIIDVLEKGYKLGDRIIRFPKVIIGQ
jgi:molecular chaperone GrpE